MKKWLNQAEKGVHWIAMVSVFFIMIAISLDAAGRSIFNSPIQGTYEVVEMYFMVMVVFLGLSNSYKSGEHVNINVLYRFFPERAKHWVDSIGLMLSLFLFLLITIKAYQMTYDAWINEEYTFGIVNLPMVLSYIWVPLGAGLLTLRLGVNFVESVQEILGAQKKQTKEYETSQSKEGSL